MSTSWRLSSGPEPRNFTFPTSLAPGRHRLVLQVSDYQEDKNSETVPRVLPNTRFYSATFTVIR